MSTNKSIEMSKQKGLLKIKELNTDELNFGDVSTNQHNGKFVNLQLNGNPFKLQMPKLKTWGIKSFNDESKPNEPPKYHLNLVFSKQEIDTDNKVKEALNKLEDMQNKIKEMLKERSKEFFNKKSASMDFIDACFNPFIVKSKDKETQEFDDRYSHIKLKLGLKKDGDEFTKNFMPKFFSKDKKKLVDEDDKEITSDNHEKFSFGTEAKCSIQPGMIWFMGSNKCGVTWNLHQAVVEKLIQRKQEEECLIQDSSDDEDNTTDGSSDSDDDDTNDD